MTSQLFHQPQVEILREVDSPGRLMEQTMASRPWPGLSSTGSPISCSEQSVLLPPCRTGTCLSVLPVTPPSCCCERRKTSASPPRASGSLPRQAQLSPRKSTQREGNQANRGRCTRARKQQRTCWEPADTCMWQGHTGSWGPPLPVTVPSPLTWAKVRGPAPFGMTPPPSPGPAAACNISSGSSLQDIQKLRQN